MTPFIEESLQYLTGVCNTTALHVSDEDVVKVVLRALYKKGEPLDSDEINLWASSNGWQLKPSKSLTEWVSKIASGGRVQLKFKASAPTEKQVLDRIKNHASVNA